MHAVSILQEQEGGISSLLNNVQLYSYKTLIRINFPQFCNSLERYMHVSRARVLVDACSKQEEMAITINVKYQGCQQGP